MESFRGLKVFLALVLTLVFLILLLVVLIILNQETLQDRSLDYSKASGFGENVYREFFEPVTESIKGTSCSYFFNQEDFENLGIDDLRIENYVQATLEDGHLEKELKGRNALWCIYYLEGGQRINIVVSTYYMDANITLDQFSHINNGYATIEYEGFVNCDNLIRSNHLLVDLFGSRLNTILYNVYTTNGLQPENFRVFMQKYKIPSSQVIIDDEIYRNSKK